MKHDSVYFLKNLMVEKVLIQKLNNKKFQKLTFQNLSI